ncbi:MAG: PCRF domain-containing protein, partial [Planctomycetota bacterium]
MSDRLPDILARYRELTKKLEDPAIATNQVQVREIMKERGRLERKAQLYEQWLKKRRELEDAEGLVADAEMREVAEEELTRLRPELEGLTEQLADEMGSDEAEQAKSVIVEVRPGTGGDEAALFANDLFDMYRRFAENRRLKFEVLELQQTELGGVREAIFAVNGA